jgi:hypothetical protein
VAFLGFLPLFSITSFYAWISEAIRMKRAGDYICFIEERVAALIKLDPEPEELTEGIWLPHQKKIEEGFGMVHCGFSLTAPLNWERWLRKSKPPLLAFWTTSGHQVLGYGIRLAFFPLVTIMSWVVGFHYWCFHKPRPTIATLPSVLILIGAFMMVVALLIGCVWAYGQLIRSPGSLPFGNSRASQQAGSAS